MTSTVETLKVEPTVALPVLPIKNTVLFPYLFLPLAAGRPGSIAAVEAAASSEEKTVLVITQRDASVEQPTASDLYPVGTKAVIKRLVRSGNTVELLVQGIERMSIVGLEQTEPYLVARAKPLPLPDDSGPEVEALHRSLLELANKMMQLAQPENPISLSQLAAQAPDPLVLAFLLASMVGLDATKEQQLLETVSRSEGLRLLYESLAHELQVLELRQKIASKAQGEMNREQKQYLLRQQLRAIHEELGEDDPEKSEVQELRKRLEEANLPEEPRKEALRELGRLERLSPASPERQLVRSWLDFLFDLPWHSSTEEIIDLDRTAQVLDEDHYGLEQVKGRILEQMAVLKLNPEAKAPILCFVGPPGVGKTSLGQSIARCWDGSSSA